MSDLPSGQRGLRCTLTTEMPRTLRAGAGSALVVAGRASHENRIERLEIGVGGRFVPAYVHARSTPRMAPDHNAFWGIVPIHPTLEGKARLRVRATLRDGRSEVEELAEIELADGPAAHPVALRSAPEASGELVGIAMATWNPPLELFRRQIQSIREQTHANWFCVISDDASDAENVAAMESVIRDDERFHLEKFEERVGFYRNFERALGLVPREATLVALADQDDRWGPSKLAMLTGVLRDGVTLAYSDMRVVAEDGTEISPTFWSHRETNFTDLRELLIANTVTGAASVFRREILNVALPFPDPFGELFHDHWLAVVALAMGELEFVDEALYDYVQHGDATQGHARANLGATPAPRSRLRWLRIAKSLAANRKVPAAYTRVYLPARSMAVVLGMRGAGKVSGKKRDTLQAFATENRQLSGWLVRASGLRRRRSSSTLGRERDFLAAMTWETMSRRRGKAGLGTLKGDADWS